MEHLINTWQSPPDKATLLKQDIHVWLAELDRYELQIDSLIPVISAEERQRASRFHFDRDKNRFIVGRAILRTILGKYYLNIEPDRLVFGVGSRGKPFLDITSGNDALRFNQADSNGYALYAVAKSIDVGVDIEYMHDMPDAPSIVESSFSAYERAIYSALPERHKNEAFFICWTRKEAFIKAIGEGLYYPLDQFDVALTPNEPAKIMRIKGDPGEAAKWMLIDLNPLKGYKGALAFKGSFGNIKYWKFPHLVAN